MTASNIENEMANSNAPTERMERSSTSLNLKQRRSVKRVSKRVSKKTSSKTAQPQEPQKPQESQELEAVTKSGDDGRQEEEKEIERQHQKLEEKEKPSAVVESKRESDVVVDEFVGQNLQTVFGVILLIVLFWDLMTYGLRAGSSGFIDWWDMIGTVSYVRGRNAIYDLRNKQNHSKISWMLYVLLDSWVIYEVTVWGFLPVLLFPGDYIYKTVEKTEIHQIIVCGFWATTKIRSIHGIVREAILIHNYSLVPAFLICLFSCELSSILSKFDKNLNLYSVNEVIQRFPGGFKAWITSRTLAASIVCSWSMYMAISTLDIPVVWFIFNMIGFGASFYRYSNWLLHKYVPVETLTIGNDGLIKFQQQLVNKLDNVKSIQLQPKNQMDIYAKSFILGFDQFKKDITNESRAFVTTMNDLKKMHLSKPKTKTI